MNSMRIRLVVGCLVWIGVGAFVVTRVSSRWSPSDDAPARQLVRFASKSPEVWTLQFQDWYVARIGDPIFWRDEQGELRQIGMIGQVESSESVNYSAVWTRWATATFFSSAPPIESDAGLVLYETPASMRWVFESLLPPRKREELARFIGQILAENSDVLLEQLRPVVLEALSDTGVMMRDELAEVIVARADQWRALGERYKKEIIEEELVPLVNTEIWPVVQEEMTPIIQKVGEKVWQEASVWGFGWRAVYDTLPLPQRDLTKSEFSRFVQQTALPIIAAHVPEFLEAQQRILVRVVENPRIRQFATDALYRISNDPELRDLIVEIVHEAIVENEEFHRKLDEIWNREDIRQALRVSDKRFGPYVEMIGEKLFGSPTSGVTPEFARILRHRVLLKDMRWLELTTTAGYPELAVAQAVIEGTNTLPVVFSGSPSDGDNPFFIEARNRK